MGSMLSGVDGRGKLSIPQGMLSIKEITVMMDGMLGAIRSNAAPLFKTLAPVILLG